MNKLQSIKKGSAIIDQIFWEVVDILKAERNITEHDLARFIRGRARELGASGMAFPPIVAFGQGSSEIHHFATNKKIGRNSFLMLDYGVKVNGFCTDFTRTLFLGKPNKLQTKIYNIVLRAQLAAIKQVRIGADCASIDLTARNIIAKDGYARNFPHTTGHGVGLKIHETPSISAASPSTLSALRSPLVITIEPGIYLPGKFGVRIEDMILVGKKSIVFSKVPKDWKSMIIK